MRNLTSLSTKLTALVALPLMALVIVAGLAVGRAFDDVARNGATAEGVELSLAAAETARQLSLEGELSASVVSAPDDGSAETDDLDSGPFGTTGGKKKKNNNNNRSQDLGLQRLETDETVDQLHSMIERGSDTAQLHLGPALDGLGQLDDARAAVDRRQGATAEVVGSYADIADPVLDVDRLLYHSAAPQLVARLDAHLALTRAIQAMAQERSLVTSMLSSGVVDPGAYNSVIEVATSQRHWLGRFENTASTKDLERYSAARATPAVNLVERLRARTLAAGPGGPAAGSPVLWSNTATGRIDTLEALADDTARELAETADARRSTAEGRRTRALLLFLAALGLAGGAVVLVHRWVLAPIHKLAQASRDAAEDTIPKAVKLAETDGDQVARSVITPLPSSSTTELRAVAEAFNTLQDTTIELAAEGASARGDVSTVFLNFGQRTQSLVTRQLSHIDNLEARTDDPDTLADLFLLDHLTTRLRRNAESLVVLAGAESPRPWARPISAVNVVRAAVAETADYSRVDLLPMAPAMLVGACANDVSHLLAELIDNALAFSPPESPVIISGDAQADGQYLVAVSDAGKGMSTRQLAEANERIAHTPVTDVGRARYFGLFVVGRLAKRHDLTVQLSPSRFAGVKAEVLLPRSVLVGATTSGAPAPLTAGNGSYAATFSLTTREEPPDCIVTP
jgi:signal transduction histidine kinase